MRTSYNAERFRGAHGMKCPCLVRLGVVMLALTAVPLALAHSEEVMDTFAVEPLQAVSFGGGDGDSFSVEQISRSDNTVTVLMRPMGESCVFRFPVTVGRSVQLRADTPSGQSLLCKATLQPITEDGTARFGAECNEAPASHERKCPPDGDTASVDHPQH